MSLRSAMALAKRAVIALEQIAKALAAPPLVDGPEECGGRKLSEDHLHLWVTKGFGPTHCLFCGANSEEMTFFSASSRSEPLR